MSIYMNMNMHSYEPDAQRIEGSAEPRHFIKVSFTLHEHRYHSEMVHEIEERDTRSCGRIEKSSVMVSYRCL